MDSLIPINSWFTNHRTLETIVEILVIIGIASMGLWSPAQWLNARAKKKELEGSSKDKKKPETG